MKSAKKEFQDQSNNKLNLNKSSKQNKFVSGTNISISKERY